MKISLQDFCEIAGISLDCVPNELLFFSDENLDLSKNTARSDDFPSNTPKEIANINSNDVEHGFLNAKDAFDLFLQKINESLISFEMENQKISSIFLEKTLQTMYSLHEKIMSSCKEKIDESSLLEKVLLSLQDEITTLKDELKITQTLLSEKDKEIEFLRRKHQLMWGKINSLNLK